MARLKRWVMRWILKHPRMVRIFPTNYRLLLLLGKVYQYAGQYETALCAYRRVIRAKPAMIEPYQLASKVSKRSSLKAEWISFLWQVKEASGPNNTIATTFLLQDDVSLTGDERITLLVEAVQQTGEASLTEKLVQELIKEDRLEEFDDDNNLTKYVEILSVVQCERLLDFALLISGERVYHTLTKFFLEKGDFSIPEHADIRIAYFTNKLSDDELFRMVDQHDEQKLFYLQLAVKKALFYKSKKLLTRCIRHILLLDKEKIKEGDFNLASLGAFLQKQGDFLLAVEVYKKMHQMNPANTQSLAQLVTCYRELGDLSKALEWAQQEIQQAPKMMNRRKVEIIQSEMSLLRTVKQEQAITRARNRQGEVNGETCETGEGAVLHVLNNSVPYSGNGYAIRSKYIIDYHKKLGLRPVVVTRLGFPSVSAGPKLETEQVDGVLYYRLRRDLYSFSRQPVQRYLAQYAKGIDQVVQRVNPRLIHAASNFYNGYPALQTAQKSNIPFVYEVRGFWEMSKSAVIESYSQSEKYTIHHGMEFHVMKEANHIVTISNSLKNYIVSRGIDPDRITVVPNAVDSSYFTPRSADVQLIDKYDLKGKTVIGFIGSITVYEGLDTLLRAVKKIIRPDLVVLIVGTGAALDRLKTLAKRLDIEKHVIFAGRVPFQQVRNYYSIMDIFPFPRIPSDVSQLVTPLKPYEAMAMRKTVLVSNLAALREMVIDGDTGLYFRPGDIDDLAEKLNYLISDESARWGLASRGREWVVKNRDWRDISKQYRSVYEQLSKH